MARGVGGGSRRYPRRARVGELLREVVAEELARIAESDDRIGLVTVTAVEADPEFRQAVVLLSSMPEALGPVLDEHRVRLQAAIARQVRLKRTPQLRFAVDKGVEAGQRIDEILRTITPVSENRLSTAEDDSNRPGDGT